MWRAPAVLLVLAACATAEREQAAAAGDVVESFEVQPYIVSGATITQLRTALRALRPAAGDGARFDAITRWEIKYRYHFDPDAIGGCGPAGAQVHLEMHMEFPTLGGDVPPQTRIAIESYLTALRVHENGHVRIDREIAAAVVEAVRGTPPQPSCERLREAVRAAAGRVVEEGHSRNREYDARTRHGATQRAVFPTP
jgi:predicted secreted Zn-dependent protease